MGNPRKAVIYLCLSLFFCSMLIGTAEGQKSTPAKPASFGYDIFKTTPGPISEGPVDEQYLLSPGDEVVLTLWGALNSTSNLTISEEGFLELPEEGGRISTNGVSLKELKARVTQALSLIHASYINAEDPSKSTAFVDVKLGKIRKVLLYVVGEVQNPGAYTLTSGTATIINLLHNAGGVRESGSLREIKIRRADGKIDNIDIYDFLLTGKLDVKKSRLQSGDYVIVPLKQKSITILGEVRRPMNYELIGNEGIKDLVTFAGGFTSDAYLLRSQLKRFVVNRGEVFLDLDLNALYLDPKKDYTLIDQDELTVLGNVQVRKSVVTIKGDGVVRPGNYEFQPGMTLKDLVERAEGLREYVYLDRADLVRTETDFSKNLSTFSLKDLYKEEKPGVYSFIGTNEKNFALKEMDEVSIYSIFGMMGKDKYVTLEGRVKEPGRFVLAKNMTLFDIVFAHGGFQDQDFRRTAYQELAHVIRKVTGQIGQKIIPFNLGKLIDGDKTADMPLTEEDIIRIYANELMLTKAKVEIVGLVNKPGVYDLSEDLTVEDLVVLAGGLRADAYKVEAVVARTESSGDQADGAVRGETTIRVPIEQGFAILPADKKTHVKAYDRITVRNLPGWEPLPVVLLRGEILYPGNYSLENREERISSLIKRAGGLKPEALPEGAMIKRNRNIIAMVPGDTAVTYEITLDLVRAIESPGGRYDLILKDGDEIFVPNNPGTVEVRGAVQKPLILQHKDGMSVKDYVALCGGYLETADPTNVILYSANNTTRKVGGGLFRPNPVVTPGSTIEVPFQGQATRIETVEVKGAVMKPAVIQYIRGAKLGYYLNLCGGYSKNADVDKVVVHMLDGGMMEKKENTAFNPIIPAGAIIVITEKASAEAIGTGEAKERIMEAAPIIEEAKSETIEVSGAVAKPAVVPYIKGAKLGYYINMCGGLAKEADPENISIRLADGGMIVKQTDVPFNPVVPLGGVIVVAVKK